MNGISQKQLFINANAFIDGQEFKLCDIVAENGKISEIRNPNSSDANENFCNITDVKGNKMLPGFIDLQINGCGGIIYNDDTSPEKIRFMKEINFKSGTTTFLPTLVTTSDEKIDLAINNMKKYHERGDKEGVPGIHIEGPFISLNKSGIHNKKFIRKFSDQNLEALSKCHNEIAMMTISPEQFTKEQLCEMANSGIVMSIGHSACNYDECANFLGDNNPITCATHLFNAMTVLSSGRSLGVTEAIFDKKTYAGIIADLCHVHPVLVNQAFKLLGPKLFLVTDALASASAPNDFNTFSFCDKQLFVKEQGFCAAADGTLGGSSLTMNKGIKNIIENCNIPEREAIAMATEIPSKVIGLHDKIGKISIGMTANLTVMDNQWNCMQTIEHGKTVYTI